MKIKVILLSLISVVGISKAFAQGIEYDDMYFNSKDRAKLQSAQKADKLALASVKTERASDTEELNPTDSYSARHVNPEFTSRAQSQTAQADEEDYFVNNYQYNNSNNYDTWNNNFNNWYGNSWYRPNYWGSSINTWNSPYYGYDSWNSPWYDPYWSYNGWSSSFSFHYGNTWNYGWGGHYNYWNRPYCAFNNYYGYGPAFGYGANWYWNSYRPTVVVINNNEGGRAVVAGKRPTRGNLAMDRTSGSRSRSNVISTSDRNTISNGRTTNSGRSQSQYYDRSWRTRDASTPAATRSQTEQNRSRSWSNNPSWNNSGNRSSSPSYSSPSRSNSSFNSGSRSSSSSGSSSGTNGRTRGRD